MTTGLDPSIQAKLLDNPQVKEAMKNAGTEALQNSAVQDAIMKAAKENLTAENAKIVADRVKDWAKDPEVQAKARHYAGMAMERMGQAGQKFVGCIEQGPSGVRFLAFLTSIASCAYAVLSVLAHGKGFNLVWAGIAGFQIIFAMTTILFEATPEHIARAPALSKYQDMLMEYAKFLSIVGGRGIFYIFQGLMWLIQFHFDPLDPYQYVTLGIGGMLVLMGGLHVGMQYGILPQTVVAKVKDYAGTYTQLPADPKP